MKKRLILMTLISLLLWFTILNFWWLSEFLTFFLPSWILQTIYIILFFPYFLLKFYFLLKWDIKNIFKFSFLMFTFLFFILLNWLFYYLVWKIPFEYIGFISHPFFNSIFLIFESFYLFYVMKTYFNISKMKKLLNIQKISILIQILILSLITTFTWKYFLFWIDSSLKLYILNLILLTWFNVLIVLYIIIISLYSYSKIKKSDQDFQEIQ